MSFLQKILAPDEFMATARRFYTVGVLLVLFPGTRTLFSFLIAPVLLLSGIVMFRFHPSWNRRTVVIFSSIALLTFFIEMWGIHHAGLFGSYRYLHALGPKIHSTPVSIGIIWLLTGYGANTLARHWFPSSALLRVSVAVFIMVGFDALLEVSAPKFYMWQFDQLYPPLRNFITWGWISLILQIALEAGKIDTHNKHARVLMLTQFVFFAITACILYVL